MVEYTVEVRNPEEAEIDEIIALLNRVWLQAYHEEGFYRFDRHLFDWYARSSLRRDDCFYLAIQNGTRRIIGFGLGMPRTMTIHGEAPMLFGYGSLITVDPEFQRQGIAKAIWDRAVVTGRSLGLKGSLAVIEEGSRGLQTLEDEFAVHKVPLWTHDQAWIRPLAVGDFGQYLNMRWYQRIVVRLLQGVAPVDDPRIRAVTSADHPRLLPLLNAYSTRLDLARVWDLEELATYYSNPIVHGKVLDEDGELKAVVNAAIVPFSIKGHVRSIGIMENLNYEDVPLADQRLLIRALLHELKTLDVAFASDFGIGYNSARPIESNRFLKYDRKMTLYFFPVSDPEDAVAQCLRKHCDTTYIDVR